MCLIHKINLVPIIIDIGDVWLGRWAIKSLEEERNKLMTDLNVVIQSKSKIKENDRYKAKFVDLIYDTKHAEIELMEQRKLEKEVDREILQMEIQLNKPKTKTNKFILCDGPSLTIVNIHKT